MTATHARSVLSAAIVLLVALSATLLRADHVDASAGRRVYSVGAETFDLPSGASTFASKDATWGAAVNFTKNGTASRNGTMPAGTRFVVRARGKSCGVAPHFTLRIDGKAVVSASVHRSAWADYEGHSTQSSGTHKLSISYDNDRPSSTCDQRVSVDLISVFSTNPANQGTAGSRCAMTDLGQRQRRLPSGWSSTALGTAPGYYETGPPSGAHAGKAPRGVMLLIHGGGWFVAGPGAAANMRSEAQRWQALGWRTVSMTSGKSCGRWMTDTLWFYDQISTRYPSVPVCALGTSAGGHLALMLAAKRPSLDCAISAGAPTDLTTVGRQRAYSPTDPSGQAAGPKSVRGWAVAAFGEGQLAALSPSRYASSIKARVVLGIAERDILMSTAQAVEMERALDGARRLTQHDTVILEHGSVPWVHAGVSQAALGRFRSRAAAIAAGGGSNFLSGIL